MSWPASRTLTALAALAVCGCAAGDQEASTELPGSDGALDAPEALVFVDGIFDEWSESTLLIEDPRDAPGSEVDLRSIHLQHDDSWMYLAVDFGQEVNAQSLPGSVIFLLDTNPGSGGEVHGMSGVDLMLELSHVADPAADVRGQGFALRAVSGSGLGTAASSYELGVVVAPTWSANRFEMRVSRAGSTDPVLPRIGDRLRIGAVYVEQGAILDRTTVAEYEATASPSTSEGAQRDSSDPRSRSVEDRLARPTGTTRVAQMNVSGRSFDRGMDDFARALAAVDPDVLLLDELSGDIEESALRDFFDLPSLKALGTWSFVVGTSGGRQRAAVATRTGRVRPAEGVRDVRYAAGAIDALKRSAPEAFHPALDREESGGLSAAAGWISIGEREVLFAAVDLQSQGWIGSAFDRLRTLQAETLRDHIVREVEFHDGGPMSPIVIGGDLNMVGSRVPLHALTTGLPSAGEVLETLRAERLGERTLSTWRNPGAPFAPGRLDFILVSPSSLEAQNAFVFATEDLAPGELLRLDLERGLSGELSDHLIVVADLRLR
jgi:endonuclease/exonuclease/phosphatase family metal-dependent hydrolase